MEVKTDQLEQRLDRELRSTECPFIFDAKILLKMVQSKADSTGLTSCLDSQILS